MRAPISFMNVLVGTSAVVFAGAHIAPAKSTNGPVLDAAVAFVTKAPATTKRADSSSANVVVAEAKSAVEAFASLVRPLSHPKALEAAFRGYFAYKTTHPAEVRKPYLYFVDYGLPSTAPRGYVFDMETRTIIDGPFTVAHGRGSSTNQYGVPTHFSNSSGSSATSLGLYVAKSLYDFHGHASGQAYSAVGLRLAGISSGFNDKAFDRGVVAHGAPYVTADKAGRSQGCPAMEPARAQRLLPKLADGGMVFLFAPDQEWMSRDPWLAASGE